MTPTELVLAVAAVIVWTLVALTSGIALGRGIHLADTHETTTAPTHGRPIPMDARP